MFIKLGSIVGIPYLFWFGLWFAIISMYNQVSGFAFDMWQSIILAILLASQLKWTKNTISANAIEESLKSLTVPISTQICTAIVEDAIFEFRDDEILQINIDQDRILNVYSEEI